MSGLVLELKDVDYTGIKAFGRVVIDYDHRDGVSVTVDGFTFEDAQTCRTHVTKAMAWARDVLAAAVEADRLIPGGHLKSCSGMDQVELDSIAER